METSDIILELPWQQYEDNVFVLVKEAVDAYCIEFPPVETNRIFQISIWTDISPQISAVSFETKDHAMRHLKDHVDFCNANGLTDFAIESEERGYNDNPADFRFKQYRLITHPELSPLRQLRPFSVALTDHLLGFVATSLLNVVERIISSNMLADLPKENTIWIGINSPGDWYDHVRKLEF